MYLIALMKSGAQTQDRGYEQCYISTRANMAYHTKDVFEMGGRRYEVVAANGAFISTSSN